MNVIFHRRNFFMFYYLQTFILWSVRHRSAVQNIRVSRTLLKYLSGFVLSVHYVLAIKSNKCLIVLFAVQFIDLIVNEAFDNRTDVYFFLSILGLPHQSEWPDCVSLPWTSFKAVAKQPFEKFIPDIERAAKDLLEVCDTKN